jgi:hypothetical protein
MPDGEISVSFVNGAIRNKRSVCLSKRLLVLRQADRPVAYGHAIGRVVGVCDA